MANGFCSRFSILITKCPIEKAENFLNRIVDSLCGHSAPSYDEYSECWTLLEWWDVISLGKEFFKYVTTTGEEIDEVAKSLPPEYQKLVTECLNVRSDDIRDALVEKTHRISPAYLKDFDWKLKLNLSSDKLASIREPMLCLDLDIQNEDGRKLLSLDMSKEELKTLIDSLEEAQKNLP